MADLSDTSMLLDLPLVLVIHLITFLTFSDAYNLCCVSREWMSGGLWRFCSSIDLHEMNYIDRAGMQRYLNIGRRTRAERLRYIGRMEFRLLGDTVMLMAETPRLDKFSLQIAFASVLTSQVNQWLSIAMSKGITEVSLDMSDRMTVLPIQTDRYVVPNFFFNGSQSLRVIRLSTCVIKKECNFRGFNNLTSLSLNGITFRDMRINESLVGCPLLENLYIAICYGILKIELGTGMKRLMKLVVKDCEPIQHGIVLIDTPLLVHFEYKGPLIGFDFGGLDFLDTAIFDFVDSAYPYDRQEAWEFFSGIYSPRYFTIATPAIKILPWEYKFLKMPLLSLPRVKRLKLITSLEQFEMATVLTLLRCAMYLKTLIIVPYKMSSEMREIHNLLYQYNDLPDNFWEAGDEDMTMIRLERVEYRGFTGRPLDFRFMKFILRSSPNLKKVDLKLRGVKPSQIQSLDEQLMELKEEPMTSPNVIIQVSSDKF